MIKDISVYVYRNQTLGDCTCNGVTKRHDRLYLYVDCDVREARNHAANHQRPLDECLYLVRRQLFGNKADYCVPLSQMKDNGQVNNQMWVMAGGNFVYTSDGRYREYTGYTTPLSVHDRIENYPTY